MGELSRGAAAAKRVMSLKEPNLKMSKSHEDPRSRIMLTDTPEEVQKKIRLALTDSIPGVSYDPFTRPGVANLLNIMSHLDEKGRTCEEITRDVHLMDMREFKEMVADRIVKSLSGIRSTYERTMAADGGRYLEDVARTGARKAKENAEETMSLIREATGL